MGQSLLLLINNGIHYKCWGGLTKAAAYRGLSSPVCHGAWGSLHFYINYIPYSEVNCTCVCISAWSWHAMEICLSVIVDVACSLLHTLCDQLHKHHCIMRWIMQMYHILLVQYWATYYLFSNMRRCWCVSIQEPSRRSRAVTYETPIATTSLVSTLHGHAMLVCGSEWPINYGYMAAVSVSC